MKTHLVRWHQDHADKGLVILYADNGRVDSFDAVRDDAAEKKLPFPVLWDRDGKTFAAYGIRKLPYAYLIAADGKVVWEGSPADAKEAERRISAELAKIKS